MKKHSRSHQFWILSFINPNESYYDSVLSAMNYISNISPKKTLLGIMKKMKKRFISEDDSYEYKNL